MDVVDCDRKVDCLSAETNDSKKEYEEKQVTGNKEESSLKIEVSSAGISHGVDESFKKPQALESKGKITKLPKNTRENLVKSDDNVGKKSCDSNSLPVPYIEPVWSSIVREPYSLEVIKTGMIIDTIDVSRKPYLVFGRQSNCDVQLAHPTVSRHHAVLQHCGNDNPEDSQNKFCQGPGVYIYDLGSTHGTFINKRLIPKQKYIRLHVGHLVKFGGSTRSYVLLGPASDSEKESEKSVTELKQEADSKRIARISAEAWTEEVENNKEDQGINWGFGEDADEESDLTENPFAVTQNEELYLSDPKRSLRGWFEREGEELEYVVEEKNFGQFLCQVKLPLDDAHGRPLVAEALVKGKKKEAVLQCALEACRILDRMGLLRQANHESKKRKVRNWEEDDFYESDEDTFLDRTGTVERKREKRMRSAGKIEDKAETYETLIKKHTEVLEKLKSIREAISLAKGKVKLAKERNSAEEEEDALDAFMSTLDKKMPLDKVDIRRQKVCLAELEQEEAHLQKLINIARPTSLPKVMPLKMSSDGKSSTDVSREGIKAKGNEKISVPELDYNEIEVGILRESTEDKIAKESIHSEEKSVDVEKVSLAKTVKGAAPHAEKSEKGKGHLEESLKVKVKKNMTRDVEKKDGVDGDCSLWVPPENQTGDGKTKLNEKYGY